MQEDPQCHLVAHVGMPRYFRKIYGENRQKRRRVHLARCCIGLLWTSTCVCVCGVGDCGEGLESDFPLRSWLSGREEKERREKRRDQEERRGTSGNDLYLLAGSHSKSIEFLAAVGLCTNSDACILKRLNTSLHQEHISVYDS